MRKNVKCVLPFVVEPVKPRLCIDGSPLGTVGPKDKPLIVLDTMKTCLSQIKAGMVMTKTDDRYYGVFGILIFLKEWVHARSFESCQCTMHPSRFWS